MEGEGAEGLAVDEVDLFFGAGDAVEVFHELAVVGVAGEAVEDFDAGADGDEVTEDGDFGVPFAELPAEGVFRTVADEEDGGARVGEVVLEMVDDAAALTHAGGGDDDEGAVLAIELLTLDGGADELEAFEAEGVAFVEEEVVDGVVEAFRVEAEDLGGGDGEGAVDKDGDAGEAGGLDEVVDDVEELLGALDGEGGDEDFAAVFEGVGEDAAEVLAGVGVHFMFAPAVGAFHDDGVDVRGVVRIAQEVVVAAADIAGEEETFFLAGGAVVEVEDDLGGAEDVAGIDEGDLDAIANEHGAVVVEGDELPEGLFGIDGGVERGVEGLAFAGAFFVGVFDVGGLDPGGVGQHNLAEVAGGGGGVDVSAVALAGEVGEIPAVVDVGVGEDHGGEVGRVEGEMFVAVVGFLAVPLVKPAVEQDALAIDLDEVLGAGGGAGGAVEGDFHVVDGEANRVGSGGRAGLASGSGRRIRDFPGNIQNKKPALRPAEGGF